MKTFLVVLCTAAAVRAFIFEDELIRLRKRLKKENDSESMETNEVTDTPTLSSSSLTSTIPAPSPTVPAPLTRTRGCCRKLRFNITGKPKENLPEYEDVAYLVGFVNGHNYWLSQDKKWVIYAREDEKDPRKKHWIIGATEALGLPIEINAWLYADFKPCPEDATWDLFWDNETKQFISSSGNGNIKLECVERNDVTNKEDDWLRTMEKEEVEAKVSSSTTEDICGRRPWTNVKDYEKIYPNGHPQGFSGLPYGPDLTHRRRRGRIIDGEQANFGEWPWQVLVGEECGGSLLSEDWVITAAHCVEYVDTLDEIVIKLGEYNNETNEEPYNAVWRGVQRLHIHDDYKGQLNYKFSEYDVAMLKLDTPVTFAPHIVPVCLPETGQDFGGDNGWATGWGNTVQSLPEADYAYEDYPSILREVNVPLKTADKCENDFRDQPSQSNLSSLEKLRAGYRVKTLFLCAESTVTEHGPRDTCQGDSGGPFVVQRPDGRYVLAGITSWGEGCGYLGGYYTRLSVIDVMDWIKSKMF